RDVSRNGASCARTTQGAECPVQALQNPGVEPFAEPTDRSTHARDCRRPIGLQPRRSPCGFRRRHVMAGEASALCVYGGDARVSDAQFLPGPLAGIRILELANETGQFCGKLFGDLGADVVKIEPPGGEPGRRIGPFLDDIPHPERSLSFWHYNTSKRGITLDLETAAGNGLFGRLAAASDVILETFRPGFLASLERDYT